MTNQVTPCARSRESNVIHLSAYRLRRARRVLTEQEKLRKLAEAYLFLAELKGLKK